MIKINLLPREKRTRHANLEQELLIFALIILAATGLVLSLNFWLEARIVDLGNELKTKQAVETALNVKVGEFKKLKAQIESVEPKIRLIRSIREKQSLPVQVMDELITGIRGEKLWFEAMTYDPNGRISATGVALDNQSLARYIDALRRSPYIKGVITQRTSRRDIQNAALVEFQCQIDTGAPLPAAVANATEAPEAASSGPPPKATVPVGNATAVNATGAPAVNATVPAKGGQNG